MRSPPIIGSQADDVQHQSIKPQHDPWPPGGKQGNASTCSPDVLRTLRRGSAAPGYRRRWR